MSAPLYSVVIYTAPSPTAFVEPGFIFTDKAEAARLYRTLIIASRYPIALYQHDGHVVTHLDQFDPAMVAA